MSARLGPDPAHFVVEEIPAYPQCGEGEHVYLWIEKTQLNTHDVVGRLARAASVKERDVGVAGMKDKHAVARQWMSVVYASDDAGAFDLGPGVRILHVTRHTNKLRTGHLIGNRFILTLVDVAPGDVERARAITDHLLAHGMANYYGSQRFGHRGRNLATAYKWLSDRVAAGQSLPSAPDATQARGERRGRGRHKNKARFENKFHPSVIQSEFFNRYASARLARPEPLLSGEVVRLNQTGSHFIVESVEAELGRAQSGDLILTGPMPGRKTLQARYEAHELEQSVTSQMGLSDALFRGLMDCAPGARRDLTLGLERVSCELENGCLELSFDLPAGGYATEVLRQYTGETWWPEDATKDA